MLLTDRGHLGPDRGPGLVQGRPFDDRNWLIDGDRVDEYMAIAAAANPSSPQPYERNRRLDLATLAEASDAGLSAEAGIRWTDDTERVARGWMSLRGIALADSSGQLSRQVLELRAVTHQQLGCASQRVTDA